MILRRALCFLLLVQCSQAWYYGRDEPGDFTSGGVWPLPWKIENITNDEHTVHPSQFEFQTNLNPIPSILRKAFNRYKKWIFPGFKASDTAPKQPSLTGVMVTVKKMYTEGEYPQYDMDETYTLEINTENTAKLEANEIWGALRGLETLSHLIYQPDLDSTMYATKMSKVEDHPRFKHRGTLIDSARHFLSVSILKQHIDLMSQNKFNVLHWHLVDSEAFPYPSAVFPELSAKGAYTKRHQYTRNQVQEVIDYARDRGIRVIPEFDTPGHMGGWGHGQDGLLSECFSSSGEKILPNIFDPTNETNYDFLRDFFSEAFKTFKDNYMHFGGDEVASAMLQCWTRNKKVRQWMEDNDFQSDTNAVLKDYFKKFFKMVNETSPDTKMIVWQEVLENEVDAPNVIAHVWKGNNYKEIQETMAKVTRAGHNAILSSCWYLNYIKYGSDWGYMESPNLRLRGLYYQCDPTDFEGTDEQKKRVLGGEATMWGEYVDGTNLIQRMWPRASAVAERLWSDPEKTTSVKAAWSRLHEHRCRMLRRGYPAQTINNPDYCPMYWDPVYPDVDAENNF